ncbi:MAG TPA: DNA-3-methyladenine glycosylase [Tepidisphaeraceae bacterium]|jgi:3-methyladenine DNA glycosylase/8-oxoguanine DNA glycosylase
MWFDTEENAHWKPAIVHLRKDLVLRKLIDHVGPCTLRPRRNHFHKLVQSILSQQVSVKAAASMYLKLSKQFPRKHVTPERLVEFLTSGDEELIRSCGLSRQKKSYLLDLSQRFASGEIKHKRFSKMNDEEIVQALIGIKGIGRWTVEMLLIFGLNRTDIWPIDDLGIQVGVQKHFGLLARPKPKEIATFADAWRPYRSIASWYLWRAPHELPSDKKAAQTL